MRRYFEKMRTDKGLSVRRMAILAGLSPSTISEIERGDREMREYMRPAIAEALGIALDDLNKKERAWKQMSKVRKSATNAEQPAA